MRYKEYLLNQARARLDRFDPTQLCTEYGGALIVDIRPAEQRSRCGVLPGAVAIDRNVLEWRFDPSCEHHIAEADDYEMRIVMVCNEGYQSSLAAAQLRAIGLHRATDLIGGFQSWLALTAAEH